MPLAGGSGSFKIPNWNIKKAATRKGESNDASRSLVRNYSCSICATPLRMAMQE
jgi:hypothetical protein